MNTVRKKKVTRKPNVIVSFLNKVKAVLDSVNPTVGLLSVVLALIIVGLLNVYSATMVHGTSFIPFYKTSFFKQLAALALGSIFVYCSLFKNFDYRNFKKKNQQFFWVVSTLFLLILVLGIGEQINGAKRWISLGISSFQPSELAKLVSIIWSSFHLSNMLNKYGEVSIFLPGQKFTPGRLTNKINKYLSAATIPRLFTVPWWLWLPLLSVILIYMEPDFGIAGLTVIFPFIIAFYAGLRWRTIIVAGLIALALAILAILKNPYRLNRIIILYDPFRFKDNEGYQTVQGIMHVGTGHIFGNVGLSKYYVPELHTDYAYALIAQEYGFIGATFVAILVVLLAYFGIRIVNRADDVFGRLLAFGLLTMLVFQALYNMLMVVGSAIVTGIPFPFVSYGGSALVMNLLAVAFIVNVDRITQRNLRNYRNV